MVRTLDLSTYRSKGGLGVSGPPTWFPRAKYRIICVRLFKFYRVIYILSNKEPTEFSVCRSERGVRGGGGSSAPFPGFLAASSYQISDLRPCLVTNARLSADHFCVARLKTFLLFTYGGRNGFFFIRIFVELDLNSKSSIHGLT